MRPERLLLAPLLTLLITAPAWAAAPPAAANPEQYRRWILEMKESPRGPFAAIKWFCKDGRVLPPKDYACAAQGQGWQHGEWSDRTRQLRARGFKVANVLAGIDVGKALAAPDFADTFGQIVIERFLVAEDDGWILRKALFYRGAIQEEDEREGARKLLLAMVMQPQWSEARFLALRTGAQLLPHGRDTASSQRVRQMAATLSDQDAGFAALRAKIHGTPEAGDAARVRDYAQKSTRADLQPRYAELAAEIDRVYQARPLDQTLNEALAGWGGRSSIAHILRDSSAAWARDTGPAHRLRVTAHLLASLRGSLGTLATAEQRLAALDLSLAVEQEHLRLAAQLRERLPGMTRTEAITLLQASANAAYGTGLLTDREVRALEEPFKSLTVAELELRSYLAALRYLGLVPGWGTQQLRLQFGEAIDKLAQIEPRAELFVQDVLRGSPLLFYSQTLDALARDANHAAGVQHRLLGRDIGTGFSALNPGLARGVLRSRPDMAKSSAFTPDGIYLLPETVSELPPVAGILTAGAGNPLSHVQLLARNLGIPNVAVDQSLLPALRAADGQRIVLAVSPAGLVDISADGPQWDAVFGPARAAASDVMFEPDVAKLDLSQRGFVSLNDLRARDSGRIVGPKAAKLGELKSHFPDRIAPGVGIPFGLYRAVVLDRPYRNTGKTVYQWMVESFRKLESLPPGSPEALKQGEALRAEIYNIILNTDPGPEFRKQLRAAMDREFGPGFKGGVFVRSDTNVEDLPGFTGAGLNLTVFNVVGFENVVKALQEVWASPYTPRAWAWRQSHMKGPEHVYPAVLLLKTVPSDVSGVMITQDVDTGDPDVLSVAVNEGVGGAVEGQAAESVRIDRKTGATRLMAEATSPRRMVPQATGGIAKLPVTGRSPLIGPNEARELIAFANEIPKRFPQLGEDGKPVAADVEFGFVDGRLWLLQIRPFNESRAARSAATLIQMDRKLESAMNRSIKLGEVMR